MRDIGVKWMDVSPEFGAKCTFHRSFAQSVGNSVFGRLPHSAGRILGTRGDDRPYECFIDVTFLDTRGRGNGVGVTQRKKYDNHGGRRHPPPAGGHRNRPARSHDSPLVQHLFGFMLT